MAHDNVAYKDLHRWMLRTARGNVAPLLTTDAPNNKRQYRTNSYIADCSKWHIATLLTTDTSNGTQHYRLTTAPNGTW